MEPKQQKYATICIGIVDQYVLYGNDLANSSLFRVIFFLFVTFCSYPDLVDAVQALMYGKSVKTRQDCFLLLRELLTVAPGALWRNFDQLMSCIQYSLSDENTTSNMKIDALGFMCCMLQTHNPQVFTI